MLLPLVNAGTAGLLLFSQESQPVCNRIRRHILSSSLHNLLYHLFGRHWGRRRSMILREARYFFARILTLDCISEEKLSRR